MPDVHDFDSILFENPKQNSIPMRSAACDETTYAFVWKAFSCNWTSIRQRLEGVQRLNESGEPKGSLTSSPVIDSVDILERRLREPNLETHTSAGIALLTA